MQYNRSFDIHEVSGLLVYQQREKINANSGSLQKSLPYRNQVCPVVSLIVTTAVIWQS